MRELQTAPNPARREIEGDFSITKFGTVSREKILPLIADSERNINGVTPVLNFCPVVCLCSLDSELAPF